MLKKTLIYLALLCSLALVLGQNSLPLLSSQSYLIPTNSMNQLEGSVFIGGQGFDNSIVVVSVNAARSEHPVHFHIGDCGSGGDIAVPLEPIDSLTGLSVTLLDIPPEAITDENHYLNIHASSADLATVVACVEIGKDSETGNQQLGQMDSSSQRSLDAAEQTATGVRAEEFQTLSTAGYRIFSVPGSQIFGQIQVSEQSDETVNLIVTLEGYGQDERYPMDIRAGDCGPDGVVIIELSTFPFGLVEPSASLTNTTLPFESFAEADNYLTIYDQEQNVLACGEVGLGANSQ